MTFKVNDIGARIQISLQGIRTAVDTSMSIAHIVLHRPDGTDLNVQVYPRNDAYIYDTVEGDLNMSGKWGYSASVLTIFGIVELGPYFFQVDPLDGGMDGRRAG